MIYSECIQITRQFAFCPNAFRVDLYKGCSYGCTYCFANMDWAQTKQTDNWAEADFGKLERLFHKALRTNDQSKDILIELLRHRVPIHCGGMSDPFQHREWSIGLTRRFIELTKRYNYPVQFSTKTSHIPDDYFNLLDPSIHIFQLSIMGYDDEYIRKWEKNTPTAKERLQFAQNLKDRGFWVGVRIQPIIDIDQAAKLCEHLPENIDYVTVEHFKAVYDVHSSMNSFLDKCNNKADYTFGAGKLQAKKDVKIRNIQRLMAILNDKGIKIGVGDNDLHYMSQSRCCCGIDTANENFQNYLKYNLTYMSTGEFENDLFIPTCNPRKHINDQKYGLQIDCKQYIMDYINNHPDFLGPKRANIEKKLFGITRRKLI